MKNISFEILKTAEALPGNMAISSPINNISYKGLKLALWNFAVHMRMCGIDNTSCVAIRTNEHDTALCSILAIGMIGARWVRATPSALNNPSLKITHLLHTETMQPISGVTTVKIDGAWWQGASREMAEKYAPGIKGNRDDSDIWMIAQSSGTTGTKKFMQLSYEDYWNRNNKALLTHDFTPVITACLFPSLSGAWVSYNLRTLRLQGTLVLGNQVDFFLAKNVQKVFGSPLQFEGFFKVNGDAPLKRLPIAHVAGATISRGFAENILQRFNLIHNFYGATEVGGVARKLINVATDETMNVGRILEGNKVKIIDEKGQEVPHDVEGLIGVQNNIMVSGYLDNDEATSKFFREGWFYSGDRGYITAEGELFITGRSDDILNIGGVKINAADIDRLIKSCPEVADGICFHLKKEDSVDRFMALICIRDGENIAAALSSLARTVGNESHKAKRIDGVFIVDKIPRNSNGKPLRNEAHKIAGELTPHMLETA